MPILYSDEQHAIASESRRALDAQPAKDRLLALVERSGEWDRPFWDLAVAQGWPGMALPEAFGGLGLGLVELGLVAQASGAATAGAPFLTTNFGAGLALLAGNDEAARQCWLPALADGSAIGAVAFGEGSAPLPSWSGVNFANGRLTGVKPAVPAGLRADFAIVWAGIGGQGALVLADLKGVDRRTVDSFDNCRLYADLIFADTPATLLLAGDAARNAALGLLGGMAVVTAHEALGGAEQLMQTARDYAITRKAFGQPIGAFQSVKHRIAELYGLVELARANCIRAATCDGQADFLLAAAAARLSAGEAYDTAARDCVQIHGGIGVTWDAGLHLHSRRARSLAVELGNALFWEDLLVTELTGVTA